MRKKLQIGLCLFLILITIASVLGIWISQKGKKKTVASKEVKQQEEESSWAEENRIDWDAYFEQGGYFGDYGDESVSYNRSEVKGLDIKAEYATIHINHSEEVSGVEVFTQIGQQSDAISCRLIDGIITIIQANLDEESKSDGSYIEVTIPVGMELESFQLMQQDGVTSIASDEFIRDFSVNLDAGSLVAESIHGKNISAIVNSGSMHMKNMQCEEAALEVEEGSIRMNVLDVTKSLKLKNEDGTISLTLWEAADNYALDIKNIEGTVEIDGEDYVPVIVTEEKDVPVIGEVHTGNIYIDMNGKED